MIEKMTRYSKDAKLSITGKDIVPVEDAIMWNDDKFRWIDNGPIDALEAAKEAKAFRENPIVQALNDLMESNGNHWRGSAEDLLENAKEFGFEGGAKSLGKKLQSMKDRLEQSECITVWGVKIQGGNKRGYEIRRRAQTTDLTSLTL